MKNTLLFILTFIPVICFGQINQFKYPGIPGKGKNIQAFIPKGWQVVDSAFGIIHSDKTAALVIQSPDILDADSSDPASGFNPKMLVILLKQPADWWKLSSVGIKIFDTTGMGVNLSSNTYLGIQFMHDTLSISFGTGGTVNDYSTYYFRYQNNDWYSVGEYDEEDDMQQSEGVYVTSNRTVNFIKSQAETATYDTGTKRYKKNKNQINVKPLVKLEDFDNRTGE